MADDKREEVYKPISRHREEEDYFFKRDQELLRALREKADEERRRRELERRRERHWMRCPKCGAAMEELAVDVLKIDRCSECRGVYFDDGELEILRHLQAEKDFIARLVEAVAAGSSGTADEG